MSAIPETARTPSGRLLQMMPLYLHGSPPTHVFMIPLGSYSTVRANAWRVAASLARLDGPGFLGWLSEAAETSARREGRRVKDLMLSERRTVEGNENSKECNMFEGQPNRRSVEHSYIMKLYSQFPGRQFPRVLYINGRRHGH